MRRVRRLRARSDFPDANQRNKRRWAKQVTSKAYPQLAHVYAAFDTGYGAVDCHFDTP